jgi:tRNA-2-methylthio-N6-dimethylallyladenosine synthase
MHGRKDKNIHRKILSLHLSRMDVVMGKDNKSNMPKVYIETYGCQMNVNDTEVIFSILKKAGYERTETMEEASVILANTCSVRDNAEQRIWGRIEQFKTIKKEHDNVVIGIVGCMAERLKDKLLETHDVDLVVGPDAYRSLPLLLSSISHDHPQINVMLSREETYGDIEPVRIDKNGVSAFISIMRGCNNACSYCVVPYTRGAERSRDPKTIVKEACNVFQAGYKEVTLLGQNVDSYFWNDPETSDNNVNFAQLLELVAKISPELRVRFSTSHPKDISDEVIYTMAMYENICKHIHLPVQSGSDRLLEKMRRRYTREWYLERVAKIREVMPGCGLTTDIIAGFCSETEEDHLQTLSLMEKVGFDYAYMFQYSERPGTLAAKIYPDDVPPEVKTKRLNEIIELQGRLSLKSNEGEIGKNVKILVEGPSKRNPEELCGRASDNKMCVFPCKFPKGFVSTVDTEGMPGIRKSGNIKVGDYVIAEVTSCTSATLICKLI